MKITYLDGPRLKRALIAGSRRIITYREQLNTINVFPVADIDTGTISAAENGRGRVVRNAMVRGAEAGKETIISLLRRRLGPGGRSGFAIGHVGSYIAAQWFRERIRALFNPQGEVFILDASPALATHTGFGTVAVAYLEPRGERERA